MLANPATFKRRMAAISIAAVMLVAVQSAVVRAATATTLLPRGASTDVVEVLPVVNRKRVTLPTTVQDKTSSVEALENAKTAIETARQTGDARFWGRAQAAIQAWWDLSSAPTALGVMQATVQQGRHEFAAAEATLSRVLKREPANAQALLALASLQRLSGRYDAASQSCERMRGVNGAGLYAQVCQIETRSLQGQWGESARRLTALIAQTPNASQASWMLSLLAESQERAGLDQLASAAFEASLARMPDLYTAIAHADLLLRTGKPLLALQKLATQPESDAVLLRRAIAQRRLGDAAWTALRDELIERDRALRVRGDDPLLHARELAMAALWLNDDATGALQLAKANLKLQREPIDWWIAVRAATAAHDLSTRDDLMAQARASGLRDARLAVSAMKAASAHGF